MMLGAAPALVVEPDKILHDPKLESRAGAISAELRCLVCQNQSIDASSAPLARLAPPGPRKAHRAVRRRPFMQGRPALPAVDA
jgi:hypothetical protein